MLIVVLIEVVVQLKVVLSEPGDLLCLTVDNPRVSQADQASEQDRIKSKLSQCSCFSPHCLGSYAWSHDISVSHGINRLYI